jgi:catechol 2,3-dioxygenase-like lactoylglutathione lyase family enzyme
MTEIQQYPLSVMLTCKDPKKSVAFYRDILGFTVKECWPDEENPHWANMVLDRQSVMLGCAPTEEACDGKEMTREQTEWWTSVRKDIEGNTPGAGLFLYVMVDDVDAYYEQVRKRGGEPRLAPQDQFYGIRDFAMQDPDGYRLLFYKAIAMSSCQSCGMPLKEATPGQMYCAYCMDEGGKLRPYEQILEGTIQGYFMGMMKMERAEAEKAAKEHLAKMPAWAMRDA